MPRSKGAMSVPSQAVLRFFLQEPGAARYGLDVAAGTGLPSRVVQPVLAGLEQRQWVQSGWDEVLPDRHPGTRRRHYQLTADGVVAARQALAETARTRPASARVLRPLGGTT